VTAESPAHLENILGLYDQMAIQAVVDFAVIGPGTQPMLRVDIYHSADGVNWIKKQGSGVHEIIPFPVSTTGTTYVPIGYDNGTSPSLAFVKVIVTIGTNKTTNISAHVNVRLTCNEAREAQFSRQKEREYKREHKNLPAEYWKREGPRLKECLEGLQGVRRPGAFPDTPDYWSVQPGSPAAVKRCVALGFSHYWAEQQAKAAFDAGVQSQESEADPGGNEPWYVRISQRVGGGILNKDC
jgi:hypothetical protein